jgi:endonuclease III related protein
MIKKVYDILYRECGPQHWWPCSSKNNFEIIIGAILTQNTSWNNVERAIKNLKKHNLIDIDKIIKIDNEKLADLIRSAGYYNQKAERLKIVAKFFKDCKKIDREALLNIKGIGPETADSILLYTYNKPYFVIDAYTKRIFSRLGIIRADDYQEIQEIFEKNLPQDPKLFNEYHALIVNLGKNICKKKPLCKECPLNNICKHNI